MANRFEEHSQAVSAAEWRAEAEETERANGPTWTDARTALALTGLGLVAWGLGRAIGSRSREGAQGRNGRARILADACSTTAVIMEVGVALGSLVHLGMLTLFLAGNE